LLSGLSFASEENPGSYKPEEKKIQAMMVHFSEFERGIGHLPITMMLTPEFLRIDDSIDNEKPGKGFILFNRKQKIIYSVDSEEQQIIKIKLLPVTIVSPVELKLRTVKIKTDKKAPLIAGKKMDHYQFFVNNKLCYDLFTVPELMPDVVSALKDYKQVLAGQQAATLPYMPADVYEACDLVKHTFYPKLYLEKGFPVLEQETNYSRTLINFFTQDVLTDYFVLPDFPIIEIN
jgi:hypothetical protein